MRAYTRPVFDRFSRLGPEELLNAVNKTARLLHGALPGQPFTEGWTLGA